MRKSTSWYTGAGFSVFFGFWGVFVSLMNFSDNSRHIIMGVCALLACMSLFLPFFAKDNTRLDLFHDFLKIKIRQGKRMAFWLKWLKRKNEFREQFSNGTDNHYGPYLKWFSQITDALSKYAFELNGRLDIFVPGNLNYRKTFARGNSLDQLHNDIVYLEYLLKIVKDSDFKSDFDPKILSDFFKLKIRPQQ